MDIASGNFLHKSVLKSQRGDYVDWQDNIAKLKQEERISAAVFEQFKQG